MSADLPAEAGHAAAEVTSFGVDVITLARMVRAEAKTGDRLAQRVFTSRELEDPANNGPNGLAASIVLKEAGFKAAASKIGYAGWQDIEFGDHVPAAAAPSTLRAVCESFGAATGVGQWVFRTGTASGVLRRHPLLLVGAWGADGQSVFGAAALLEGQS